MGRNKLIEDEKLLDLFDNFLLEVCGGNPNAFRYSDFPIMLTIMDMSILHQDY